MHSQEGPASGHRMLGHSFRIVEDTTMLSPAWEPLPHIPNVEELAAAQMYSRRPFGRIKSA
jgi:hypothetical protein